jgi:hypothetical protein
VFRKAPSLSRDKDGPGGGGINPHRLSKSP